MFLFMKQIKEPNYTQLPNAVLEAMSEMGNAEFKVVMAICRLTFGYHVKTTRAKLQKLQDMTGLSKQSVISGAKIAEEKGIITKIKDGGVTQWKVNLLDSDKNEKVKKLDPKGKVTRQPSIKETIKQNKPLTSTKEVEVVDPEYIDVGNEFEVLEKKNNHRPLVGALSKVTGLDIKMHAPRLGKQAKKLRVAGYTPKQIIDTFGKGGVWYSRDWRGKKGDRPSPELVVEQITNLLENPREKYVEGEFSQYIEH